MRTELWGLKNKETGELVLEYWASSQKHKALFSSYKTAQKACKWKHNAQFEPFKIEGVPVVRCKDCKHEISTADIRARTGSYWCNYKLQPCDADDFCSYGKKRDE